MGVIYSAKGSNLDSPFILVANANARAISQLLQLPEWDGGELRASSLRRRIKAVRKHLEHRRKVMEGLFQHRTIEIRFSDGVIFTRDVTLPQVEKYMDKLEELAIYSGWWGCITWG
jgi:hypothetical protein